jgi:hypothetical protein
MIRAIAGLSAMIVLSTSTAIQAQNAPGRPPFGTPQFPTTAGSTPLRPNMGGGDSSSPSPGDNSGSPSRNTAATKPPPPGLQK